jgi:nucleoid-associated protein YgaU
VTDAAPVTGREQVVGFASVDYEDADQKSMIYVTGVGTPGARVAVYVNNNFVGFAIADASGNWSFSDNRQLEGGTHVLRADVLDKGGSSVLARAEVNFQREPASDARTALFDQGSKEVEAIAEPGTDGQIASNSAADAEPRIIIVKQGDTLWHIAQEYFGDGARYTQIFQNNRGQIRNPHRIYPDQRFVLPGDKPQFN